MESRRKDAERTRAETRTRDGDSRVIAGARARAKARRTRASKAMSRQRESKEEVARRALAEFSSQIDEVARSSGDATTRSASGATSDAVAEAVRAGRELS